MGWEILALQVMNSPFNQEQVELLNQLLPILTETQQIWLGGYLSASQLVTQSTASGSVAVLEAPAIANRSHFKRSDNSLWISDWQRAGFGGKTNEKFKSRRISSYTSSMNEFKPNALKKIENLLLIVSTHGEGDPPDNALPFYEFLHSKRAPQLDNLQYSVLSLGDSSYEFFCQTGKQFDERLLELGAKQLSPRVDCDLDYDESAEEWFTNVLVTLNEQQGSQSTTVQQPVNKWSCRTSRSTLEQIHLKPKF